MRELEKMPKKILLLSANPKYTDQLRLDEEIREIQGKLKRAKHGDQFAIKLAPAARIHDLQQELLEYEPDIVHFCGHGEEEGIALEDEQGKAVLVPSEALASLFEQCANHVECVLLNSCHSRAQAEVISQHIPYVIGMKKAVGDEAAVEFAAGFYTALGFGKSIEAAFAFGKTAMHLYDLPDHLTPILLQRRAAVKTPEKIVLLVANPLNEPQDWNPYLELLKKKIACPIEQHSLNIENLNNLQDNAYLMILSKVIKNKLLIENEYLCKDTISFKELESNIGNRQLAGLFLFVDQLPEKKFLAELTLPVFLLPVADKQQLRDALYQLFTKNNIDFDSKSRVLNKAAFQLCALNGKSDFDHKRTTLPESIDRQKLKGFVGRSDDLEHICRKLMELDEGEILTVKGAGGIGKTHTVKKIAVALADRGLFSGGIHFIDCEPVTDSKQFQFKAAAVFGLELAEDLWQHLCDHHDGADRLIIFDNFEPLLYLEEQEEIKKILSKVADYAKILVTSREVLGLDCEQVHQMRRLTTDEAFKLFTTEFNVPEQQQELLRQDILSRQLDNNPQAIKLITGHLPKGKSLEKLRDELEEDLFGKLCADELKVFASGPDSNIERTDSIYVSILYSYRLLNEQEKMTFELLSLFPDGIYLEEFKKLTSKADKKDKLPLSLITDRLLKALEDKSMLENNKGQLKLQSMIGRFAQAMLKERKDFAQLYHNAFTYNRRLVRALYQKRKTDEESKALENFSRQQGIFFAAIRYCDFFETHRDELLDCFYRLESLFIDICSLDGFTRELSAKIKLFQEKERQCAEVLLLHAEYFNGDFSRAVARLQQVLPQDQITPWTEKFSVNDCWPTPLPISMKWRERLYGTYNIRSAQLSSAKQPGFQRVHPLPDQAEQGEKRALEETPRSLIDLAFLA